MIRWLLKCIWAYNLYKLEEYFIENNAASVKNYGYNIFITNKEEYEKYFAMFYEIKQLFRNIPKTSISFSNIAILNIINESKENDFRALYYEYKKQHNKVPLGCILNDYFNLDKLILLSPHFEVYGMCKLHKLHNLMLEMMQTQHRIDELGLEEVEASIFSEKIME
jgi:hypothetical protein